MVFSDPTLFGKPSIVSLSTDPASVRPGIRAEVQRLWLSDATGGVCGGGMLHGD